MRVTEDLVHRGACALALLLGAAAWAPPAPAAAAECRELERRVTTGEALANPRNLNVALFDAAQRGHAEVARLLVAAGADPALRDSKGANALDLAASDAVREALPGQ